jgi:hypothetical protein
VTYTLLCEGEPLDFSDKTLTIGFKPGFSFHAEKLLDERNKEVVQQVLQEIFNQQIALESTVKTPQNKGVDQQQAAGPIPQKAMDLFGGKFVETR